MGRVNGFLKAFSEDVQSGASISDICPPQALVERMLKVNMHSARESGRNAEREELVCRLIASGMTVEEISLILKILVDEVRVIEKNNAKIKIPEYERAFKVRKRSREKAAK